MKKILALVLTLSLVLCAVSAFAAGSTETPKTKTSGTTGGSSTSASYEDVEEPVSIIKASDTEETTAIKQLIKDGQDAGDPLSKLPDDVKTKIPAEFKTVNEMATYQLTGDVTKAGSITLTFTFETKYAEGEEITVLLGITGADETEWVVLKGVADKNGAVVLTLDQETLNKIANNPFVVIPVSK